MKNVVTLIGSTKHKEDIQDIAKSLSKGGGFFCIMFSCIFT